MGQGDDAWGRAGALGVGVWGRVGGGRTGEAMYRSSRAGKRMHGAGWGL